MIGLGIGLVTLVALHAQQTAGTKPAAPKEAATVTTLTAMDYIQIQQLVAKYVGE